MAALVKPSADWVMWANLALVIGFLLIAMVANKFMLVRNSVLRARHFQEIGGTTGGGGYAQSPGGGGGGSNITPVSGPASSGRGSTTTTPLLGAARVARRESGGLSMSSANPQRKSGHENNSNTRTPKALRNNNRSHHGFPIHNSNASFGSQADLILPSTVENHSFGSQPSGEDLESLAEEALREQQETEIDLSRVFKDGITIFYFFSTIYGLLMAIITGFVLLGQSSHYAKEVAGSLVLVITAIPLLFYYSIVASLCEKLFSLADLTTGDTSRTGKKIRRSLMAVLALIPQIVAMLLAIIWPEDYAIVNQLSYIDVGQSVIFSILLAIGGYSSNKTAGAGSPEQRSLCARVSAVSAFFILARATAVLPYFQTTYYLGESILFQFFVFNVATIVPVSGALLVLKLSPRSTANNQN